ncbi:TIGR01841 family phasin [Glaciimonas sp. GNP009]
MTHQELLMFSNLDKFSSATKAAFESQFATSSALVSKIMESSEKAIALNIAAAKAYAEESSIATKQLLSAKDPQAFFALIASQAKLNAEKAASYSSHLTEIASSVKADLTQAAEAQIAESKSKVTALVEEVAKSAPAGSENAVAMLKSVVSNANAGYEQLSKTTKQAVETVEANVAKATTQLSQAAKKTA